MIFIRAGNYTKFGERYGQDLFDLAEEAVDKIKDQGLDLGKIQALVVGNMLAQQLSHQSQLGAILAYRLGLKVPAIRTEAACASGGTAVWTAIKLIQSGQFSDILVIGAEKMTDYPTKVITRALSTAGYNYSDVAFQISFPATYAIYANYWLDQGWIDKKTLFHIAAKNHYYASLNPQAQFQNQINYQIYRQANLVAYPLNLFDCSPISDGAAALWLSNKPGPKSIRLIGAKLATGPNSPHFNPELNGLPASRKAARKLYRQAKIKAGDIDLVELHDCFTIAEAMAVVDLGLMEKKDLARFYSYYWQKKKPPQGKPVINSSGGLKACGHPIGATGVKQVAEIYLQLSRQAGRRQIKKANIGLSHNVGGSGGTVFLSLWKKYQGGQNE